MLLKNHVTINLVDCQQHFTNIFIFFHNLPVCIPPKQNVVGQIIVTCPFMIRIYAYFIKSITSDYEKQLNKSPRVYFVNL